RRRGARARCRGGVLAGGSQPRPMGGGCLRRGAPRGHRARCPERTGAAVRRSRLADRGGPGNPGQDLDFGILGGTPPELPMSVLRSIESKLESLFEGVFGRAFRTNVQPVELARKLVKEMD